MAQTSSAGAIAGVVLDQQGAAIPGVAVKITDPATNISQEGVTNDAGRYLFPAVPPSTYNITFTKQGFSSRKVNKQIVSVGASMTINATLEVGAVSNVVEVTSAPGAELETVTATVSASVSGASLIYLPLFGADAATLANYGPGVSPEGATAGAMFDQNTFQLDGGNNSNDMDGSMTVYTGSYSHGAFSGATAPPSGVLPTPGDTVEEVKVNSSGQTSDFNGSTGSQVQVVTKRGTNQFHGSAYYYYYDSQIGQANSWDNNHTPSGNLGYTPIPATHDQRYGFTVGGP
ncbi:MAG TPA: carboxypeptidase-like regulatory domain-containing protein, partial [Bryobacteraceae bacterium]